MIKLKQAVVVEGKYDKIKLSNIIDGIIIVTDGFRIFKDKEKLELIKAFASKNGVIILTDSDHSGFQIRNKLKDAVKNGKIYNVYIPDIYGKEKRKKTPTAEGKLGVEGISDEILIEAFKKAGVIPDENNVSETVSHSALSEKIGIFRSFLYDDGLIGKENSSVLRKALLHELNLPENLSVNNLTQILASLSTEENYKTAIKKIKRDN